MLGREEIDLVNRTWRHVDPLVARFVDRIIQFGVPALVLVVVLQLTSGTVARLELLVNLAGVLVFSVLVVRPGLAGVTAKIALLGTYFAVRILTSFYFNGLVGSGEVLIALLVVLSVVVLRPYAAIVVTAVAVGTVYAFALVSPLGVHPSIHESLAAGSAAVHWSIAGTVMAVFAGSVVVVVNYLRTSMLRTIDSLESANTRLEALNDRLEKRREQIERLALSEPLTGLPNRFGFESIVDDRIRCDARRAALVLFDVTNFHLINTLFGATVGDRVLSTMGRLVAGMADSDHVFANLGGDEFALWVEEYDAEKLANETRQTAGEILREIQTSNNIRFSLKIRIAAARYPEDGADYQALVRAATAALKYAKQTMASSIVFFDAEIMRLMQRDATMQAFLEKAVENDEFRLAYQSKVSIQTGETIGVEALARWSNPQLGDVSPEIFIGELTRLDRIAEFTKSMVGKVLSDIPALRERFGPDLKVSLNISPAVFLEEGFVASILTQLHEHDVAPGTIVLEITEDVFVDDKVRIERVFKELRRHGIGISLDDFGKGYSSLSYISSFEFTEIKIDRQFVKNICSDSRSYALFRSICAIAEAYNYSVVAEGVESADQIELLRQAGCEIAQGYYFSRPEALPA